MKFAKLLTGVQQVEFTSDSIRDTFSAVPLFYLGVHMLSTNAINSFHLNFLPIDFAFISLEGVRLYSLFCLELGSY